MIRSTTASNKWHLALRKICVGGDLKTETEMHMSHYTENNILEKLGKLIPGYSGYKEKQFRRDTDRLLRNHASNQISKVAEKLDSISLSALTATGLKQIASIDDLKRQIKLLQISIQYGDYGNSGFFDLIQVTTEDLTRIQEYDVQIADAADRLLSSIGNASPLESDVKKQIESIYAMTTQRKKLLQEL